MVGLKDFYDFDPKKKGERDFVNEAATWFGHVEGAPGYKICGGKQPKGGC